MQCAQNNDEINYASVTALHDFILGDFLQLWKCISYVKALP